MEKHLTDLEIIEFAKETLKYNKQVSENMDKIDKEVKALAEKHPDISNSELREYTEKLVNDLPVQILSDSLLNAESHTNQCFYCRQRFNELMGIQEDLIIRHNL